MQRRVTDACVCLHSSARGRRFRASMEAHTLEWWRRVLTFKAKETGCRSMDVFVGRPERSKSRMQGQGRHPPSHGAVGQAIWAGSVARGVMAGAGRRGGSSANGEAQPGCGD